MYPTSFDELASYCKFYKSGYRLFGLGPVIWTKILSAFFCLAVVVADKLNNVYLPPTSSLSAGGNGQILRAPFQPSRFSSSGIYQNSLQRNIFSNQQIYSQRASIYQNQKPTLINSYNSGYAQPQIQILRSNNENNGDGTYRFEYETANGIAQQESGQLKNLGSNEPSSVVQGAYSYVGPDGKTYTINYIADELGFRATGDHLPVAPPVPAEIQRSLELNAAAAARGIINNGQYRANSFGKINVGQINRQYLAPRIQGGFQAQQPQGYKY